MKTKWSKRLGSLFLAAAIALSSGIAALAAPANAKAEPTKPGLQLVAEPLSEEYKEYVASGGKGTPVSSLNLGYLGESYAKQRARTNALLPKAYDLRAQGLVPPVGNQNPYGTCWTFSALGSAESGLIEQFPHISLSNIHLAWFSNYGKEEQEFFWYKYGDGEIDHLNSGGNDQMAVGTMAAWKGPVSSSLVPYDQTTVDESLRYSADYHLQDAYYLPSGIFWSDASDPPYTDSDTVKQIMMEGRAVSISYAVGDDNLYYSTDNAAVYCDTYSPPNHAVLIAGWDDDYPKENFNEACRPEHDGAWLIRNSWGAEWGNAGYFWLSYEDATIEYGCTYNLEAADNYAHNYQYDTLGWGYSASAVDPEANSSADQRSSYMSNIFTAEETEQLEAVSFYTTDAGTKYEISVYTGLSDKNDPTSGKKLTKTQTGTEPYAGYHTIELDEPVVVTKGEAFSVVVKLTNPEYAYPLPVEFCPIPSAKEAPEFMGNGGESYVSADGKTWIDAACTMDVDEENATRYCITNVCIKAFTNPVSTVSFSVMEGSVALGTELTLSAPGADEIYYRIFHDEPQDAGSQAKVAAQKYTGPITINEDMKVQACAVKDGITGEFKEKIYTQAKSELSSLVLDQDSGVTSLDISRLDGDTYSLSTHVAKNAENVWVQPQGTDTITVNGKEITSGDWAKLPMAAPGEITTITVRSEAAGKTPVEYTLQVYRSTLSYDYRAETVSYDDNAYRLADREGNVISNGGSLKPYILEDGEAELTLTRIADNKTFTEYVPARQVAVVSPIDFVNEQTESMYGSWNEVATEPDMSDAKIWDGTPIPLTPGQNVYIRRYATDTAFESNIAVLEVPDRPAMPANPGVDYQTMMTKEPIPNTVTYAFNKEGDDAKMGTGEKIALTPGTTLYLIVAPTDSSFASDTLEVPIAAAPAAPAAPQAQQTTAASVTLKAVAGAEYRMGSGDWQASPVFEGLEPETEYTFFIRIAATDTAPASEAAVAVISTEAIPAAVPSDYSFEVKYVDRVGNPIKNSTIFFEETGPYARVSISLPYGFMEVEPAQPDDSWRYPTSLEWQNGRWTVTNPVVTVVLERMAMVDVIFKTPDGAVLEDLSYTKLYDSVGAGIETVTIPDSYEFIEGNTYAVDVTRDENGLVADPSEITFWVKAVGTEIPVTPSDYSFKVQYVDGSGNPVPGGGTIPFDEVGPYSREDIPMPYGYQATNIPAHPGDEWLNPTALVWKNGQWIVTNPVVTIEVEKQACVRVVFKLEDGTVLDSGYEDYYGEVGAGLVSVHVPEGYELIGDDQYAVDVTRDENGQLTADIAEAVFTVKKIGADVPENPSEPTDPSEPTTPSEPENPSEPATPSKPGSTDIPQTGEDSNLPFMMILLFVSGGAVLTLTMKRKKKQSLQ